jgi:hypothetical protein
MMVLTLHMWQEEDEEVRAAGVSSYDQHGNINK